jgi:hypothetical protein
VPSNSGSENKILIDTFYLLIYLDKTQYKAFREMYLKQAQKPLG